MAVHELRELHESATWAKENAVKAPEGRQTIAVGREPPVWRTPD